MCLEAGFDVRRELVGQPSFLPAQPNAFGKERVHLEIGEKYMRIKGNDDGEK